MGSVNTKGKRGRYISRSGSALPLFQGPATKVHPVPTRNITAKRVNTRLELNGGFVKLTRPLCTLSGLTGVWIITGMKVGTYPRLCGLQRFCRTVDANTPGSSSLRFFGDVTQLFTMFWANRFCSLGRSLLREDSYTLLIIAAWKGTYATSMFFGLLTLRLRRGHGDVVCVSDVESD